MRIGGANNYMGSNWPSPRFFYSPRIGRSPQVSLPNNDYADVPSGTRILGAAKLTGKIAGDWNLGVLQAVTAREMADIDLGGTRSQAEVEPLTSYSVTRAQRTFHGGAQGLGFLSTATLRRFDDALPASDLNHRAFLSGLDGWTFLDKGQRWVVTGWTARSDLSGSAARITAVQTGSAHYRQEPDNEHWLVDSSATSLTGYAGRFTVNKQKGNVQFNSAFGFVNPYFDSNDLGITSRTDVINAHISSGYRWSTPNKWRRSANITGALFGSTDFDGNVIRPGIWANGGVVFLNYWTFFPRFAFNPASLNDRLTRGGPLVKVPAACNGGFWGDTDSRKRFYYFFEWDFARSQSGGWESGFYPGVTWKPAPNLSVSVSPSYDRNHQDSQWVGSTVDAGATETFGRRYVFAQLDQTTVSASVRLNWAFSPNMSLQLYAQPLISSGNYFGYKQLRRPRSYEFDPVGGGVPQAQSGLQRHVAARQRHPALGVHARLDAVPGLDPGAQRSPDRRADERRVRFRVIVQPHGRPAAQQHLHGQGHLLPEPLGSGGARGHGAHALQGDDGTFSRCRVWPVKAGSAGPGVMSAPGPSRFVILRA
ncbi:MAG: hypothetical protein E6K81_14630 [Candidatus Eisenbacteria bacterium]|uniref:DUF5916 domain-containing protein n=1 Tax=Eiseniibacteriota bacterium TaxID=2212470 RepID=A0A538U1C1_UNCEI|nr:MAG: hypothetical protein E6K81_14630 [Candidatus Eisenbacteria bacterium]